MAGNRYETHIKPYLKEIERWTKLGESGKEIAAKLNIGYSTFRKYAASKADLASVLRNGKNHVKRVVDKALAEGGRTSKKIIATGIQDPPLMTYVKENSTPRPDQNGTHRKAFERNKKKIYATRSECGICGKPIDFSIKYPHPLSPCIDHIIPVAKGGHPSDISNLQLAHWTCNRQKSDNLMQSVPSAGSGTVISNRILPQSMDWSTYRSTKNQTDKIKK